MPPERTKTNILIRMRWFKISLILFLVVAVIGGTFLFFGDVVRAPFSKRAMTSTGQTDEVLPSIEENIEIEAPITFAIGGDVMLDRAVDYNFRGEKLFHVVEKIQDLFKPADVAIVNLEGPISATEIPADNMANNMVFNFPPTTPAVLQSMGIDAVSLANNHTNNNGILGLNNTKKVLTDAGIKAIGNETGFGEFSVGRFEKGEKKLSVITINVLENSADITGAIKTEKDGGAYVLVFPHWGTEYAATHSVNQEIHAKSWIDAGADVVIGGHPHVIQDMAVYKGKPIFYSMGNLVFDQTFSKETQQGLVLKGAFRDNGLEVEIIPIISKKLIPEPSLEIEGSAILDTLIKDYADRQIANHPRNILFFGNSNEN